MRLRPVWDWQQQQNDTVGQPAVCAPLEVFTFGTKHKGGFRDQHTQHWSRTILLYISRVLICQKKSTCTVKWPCKNQVFGRGAPKWYDPSIKMLNTKAFFTDKQVKKNCTAAICAQKVLLHFCYRHLFGDFCAQYKSCMYMSYYMSCYSDLII